MPDDSCAFSLDPEAHAREHGTAVGFDADELREGMWECPRTPPEGDTVCQFHKPPAERDVDDAVLADRLLSLVDDGDQQAFVGSRFERLELSYETLSAPDSRPIDLRHVTVDGPILLSGATVENPLDLRGAYCHEIDLSASHHERSYGFDGAVVTGDINAKKAEFRRNVVVSDATVSGSLDCKDTKFGGHAVLRRLSAGRVDFAGATVEDDLLCDQAEVKELIRLSNATVGGESLFADTSTGSINAWNARFHGRVRAHRFHAKGDFQFGDTIFGDRSRFTDVTIDGSAVLSGAEFEAACVISIAAGDGQVDLCESSIVDGQLSPPTGTVYDLSGAELGPVSLGDEETSLELDSFYFDDVNFNGFDFRSNRVRRRLADRGWTLPTSEDDPKTAESTYVKAKTGADQIGDTVASGEFFVHEMTERGRNHYRRATTDSGLSKIRRWGRFLANRMFGFIAGYGERPWRVTATAALSVLAFAATYSLIWTGEPPYDGWVSGLLVFSMESFITLVLSGSTSVPNGAVRFVAELEAFVGAFLISLFVFTLTRSVQR